MFTTPSKQRGFSLLELLAVVAVLAALSVVGVAALRSHYAAAFGPDGPCAASHASSHGVSCRRASLANGFNAARIFRVFTARIDSKQCLGPCI